MSKRRGVREGVRITRVGLWFILFAAIVGIAATNTGNNALYLVVAAMLGLLVVSWLAARLNGRGLEISVEPPDEVFASLPTPIEIGLENRGRVFARRQLLVRLDGQDHWVVHRLARQAPRANTTCRSVFAARGLHQLPPVQITSLYPLGLFRCARLHDSSSVLVFPELLDRPTIRFRNPGELGAAARRRGGWGHDLHALRPFRPGDDPRNVHWKQSARIGELVYKEHEAEECRRLAVLLDEGIGLSAELEDREKQELEQLISEAATTAVDYLERGFEVELVTRSVRIPFATGPGQRFELLEALALLEPCAMSSSRLEPSDSHAAQLRLSMDRRPGAELEAAGGRR